MNRKPIWIVCLVSLGLVIALFFSPTLEQKSVSSAIASIELRGVWLTNVASAVLFTPWGVERALNQLAELNFNTIYPVVWNRGHTFYPSTTAKQATGLNQDLLLSLVRPGQDMLAKMVTQARQHRLQVIPWFEYGLMAPASSALVERHPEWLALRRDGAREYTGWSEPERRNVVVQDQVWLNPLHPQVQQFFLDLVMEVVTQYDVTGIQFDDHFGLPRELGYDPLSVQLYQKEHQGRRPPDDPSDPEWMRWRAAKITQFMHRIVKTVKAAKPECRISLSPNSQGFAYQNFLQDWPTWVQQGWVEELVLQVYRHKLKDFEAELNQPAVKLAQQRIPVAVGILSGSWRSPVSIAQIQQQVQSVRKHKLDGISFFYWESLWGYITPESPHQRRAVFRQLFAPKRQPSTESQTS